MGRTYLSNETLRKLRLTVDFDCNSRAYPPSTSRMNVSSEASARV